MLFLYKNVYPFKFINSFNYHDKSFLQHTLSQIILIIEPWCDCLYADDTTSKWAIQYTLSNAIVAFKFIVLYMNYDVILADGREDYLVTEKVLLLFVEKPSTHSICCDSPPPFNLCLAFA